MHSTTSHHVMGVLVAASLVFSLYPIALSAQSANSAAVSAPTFTAISRSPENSAIEMRGKAQAGTTVIVEVFLSDEGAVFTDSAKVRENGEWSLTIDDSSFPAGAYTVHATAQSDNGEKSTFAEARGYKIKPQPLLSVGGLEFGWVDVFLLFFLLVLTIAGFLGWHYERSRRRREVYASIAERDFNNMCSLLNNEVDRLGTLLTDARGIEPHVAAEANYLIQNEKQTLNKMQGYLAAGIRKIQ